jgi:CheY-like chemotaxis protein
MRILLVEDDPTFLTDVVPVLQDLAGGPDVVVAMSRDSALQKLTDEFFDLIILDMKLPSVDGALDAAVAHGRAVFARSTAIAPGTPIFILTGSSGDDFFPDLLGRAAQVDIWGEDRKIRTVDYLPKRQLDQLVGRLEPFSRAIGALADVEIGRERIFDITPMQDRLLRIFTKRSGGIRCTIARLSGGLSDASVFRVKVFDASGARRIHSVAKIGSPDDIEKETRSYQKEISRLPQQATPRWLETIAYGAKDTSGVFYSLAEGFNSTVFELLVTDPDSAESAVKNLANLTRNWRDGVGETRKTVKEVRRRVLEDAQARKIIRDHGLRWATELEKRPLQVRWSCIHGDLHGANVLVDVVGTPVLIDYGDVGHGPAALDPLTLELSIFFHPQSPLRNSGWPSAEQAEKWGRLDEYLVACPIPNFVRACRASAEEAAAGHREMATAAYGYLLRQLKYADTDKDLTLALLRGAYALFSST